MDNMTQKNVEEYEVLMHRTKKEWFSPGYLSIKLTKDNHNEKFFVRTSSWLLSSHQPYSKD